MDNFKILHFADVHCREKNLEEITECLNQIIQIATDNRPGLIVMAGDTFDSRMIKLDSKAVKTVFESYQALADIAPMVVIIGTPSHDGLAPEVMGMIKAENEIYVAERPEQTLLTHFGFWGLNPNPQTEAQAVISCLPAPTKQYWEQAGYTNGDMDETNRQIADALGIMMAEFGANAAQYPGIPHILIGHVTVGGCYVSETQTMIGRDIKLSREQIGYANADLVCLGHIHYAQKIEPNIFYAGSIARLNYGELETKGAYIHTLGKDGLVKSEFHETPSRKRIKIDANLTNGCRSVIDAFNGYDPQDLQGARIRLNIKVFQDEAGILDLDGLKQQYPGIDMHIQRVPRETVRSASILKVDTLPDKIKAMAELRNEDVPETVLQKAADLEAMDAAALMKKVVNG